MMPAPLWGNHYNIGCGGEYPRFYAGDVRNGQAGSAITAGGAPNAPDHQRHISDVGGERLRVLDQCLIAAEKQISRLELLAQARRESGLCSISIEELIPRYEERRETWIQRRSEIFDGRARRSESVMRRTSDEAA